MVGNGPRHAVEIFGRKNGPDKKMRPERSAGSHDRNQGHGNMEGQQRGGVVFGLGSETMALGSPPDRPSPVAHKGQTPDKEHTVAANTVVCTGEVYRGYGVRATECKKGHVLEDQGGNRDFDPCEVQIRENAGLDSENEK
jgi:hypothetical protein